MTASAVINAIRILLVVRGVKLFLIITSFPDQLNFDTIYVL
jgi:hypothetical protein